MMTSLTRAVRPRRVAPALLIGCMTLAACGSDDAPADGSSTPEDLSMSAVSDGPLVLDAIVTEWSDAALGINYTTTNASDGALLAFGNLRDVSGATPQVDGASTPVRLYFGKRVPGECGTGGESPPDGPTQPFDPVLLTATRLAPGAESTGSLRVTLPLTSRCGEPLADPTTIEFCVGYATPETAGERATAEEEPGGRELYPLFQDDGVPTFACVTLER